MGVYQMQNLYLCNHQLAQRRYSSWVSCILSVYKRSESFDSHNEMHFSMVLVYFGWRFYILPATAQHPMIAWLRLLPSPWPICMCKNVVVYFPFFRFICKSAGMLIGTHSVHPAMSTGSATW